MENFIQRLKKSAFGQGLVHFYPYAWLKHAKEARQVIRKLRPNLSGDDQEKLCRKMLAVYCRYHFKFDEFFCYGLDRNDARVDPEWVADVDRLFWVDKFNSMDDRRVFADKWATYEKFGKYFGRDVCRMDDQENAFEFIRKHSSFIVKPRDGSLGIGVRRCEWSQEEEVDRFLGGITISPQKMLMEEFIRQVDEMAVFHPSSVNTIRMSVIRLNDETVVFRPFMRLGRGGSIVDNAGQGGLIAAISPEDGVVIACGDEYGRHYEVHPDTGVKIVGFRVPAWEEACRLGRELAEVLPTMRYLSWDFALTNNGWVIVEGDEMGQIVAPLVTGVGVRSELNSYLKRI